MNDFIPRRRFLTGSALLAACGTRRADTAAPAVPTVLVRSLRPERDELATIEGRLPAELAGTLYRNGPGLFERDGVRKGNMLDGDGMVRRYQIGDGTVRFCNRFVRTDKFVQEEQAGAYGYASWATRAPGGARANFGADDLHPRGDAGVTVIERDGRLYCFSEATQPWVLDAKSLETIGYGDLGHDRDPQTVLSAHWKVDTAGRWCHFGIDYQRRQLYLLELDAGGRTRAFAKHALPRLNYAHDWFVTDRHFVVLLHPCFVRGGRYFLGLRSLKDSFDWRSRQPNLLLVFRRNDPTAAPVTLEADARWMWHSINAYDHGDEIVCDFVGFDAPDHFIGRDAALDVIMDGEDGRFDQPGRVRRYVIDPRARRVREQVIHDANVEFPFVDPRTVGRRHRYAYVATSGRSAGYWSGVTRVDHDSGEAQTYDFGDGAVATEPVFVPRGRGEADGWLLVGVHDARRSTHALAVLDAASVTAGPLALAHLDHHVPMSFHGHWRPA